MMLSAAVHPQRSPWAGHGHARGRSAGHRGLVWVLILALAVYATSGGILRTVGPKHWHATDASVARSAAAVNTFEPLLRQAGSLLATVRTWTDAAHARAHALGVPAHHHSHSAVLRHWHDADDDTVRTVADEAQDPSLADLKAAAAVGGATLAQALATHGAWQLPARGNGRWAHAMASRWCSALLPPPVEPPIA